MNRANQALAKLKDLHAKEFQHINGDLETHLKGTYTLLKNWGNSEYVCLAGLYHAVYGTDGFPEQLVSLNQRNHIAEIIGDPAEELVYFYGACDRSYTYQQIIHSDKPTYKDRFTNKIFIPSKTILSFFCELTLANELEIARENQKFHDTCRSQLITLFNKFDGHVSINGFKYFKKVFSEFN